MPDPSIYHRLPMVFIFFCALGRVASSSRQDFSISQQTGSGGSKDGIFPPQTQSAARSENGALDWTKLEHLFQQDGDRKRQRRAIMLSSVSSRGGQQVGQETSYSQPSSHQRDTFQNSSSRHKSRSSHTPTRGHRNTGEKRSRSYDQRSRERLRRRRERLRQLRRQRQQQKQRTEPQRTSSSSNKDRSNVGHQIRGVTSSSSRVITDEERRRAEALLEMMREREENRKRQRPRNSNARETRSPTIDHSTTQAADTTTAAHAPVAESAASDSIRGSSYGDIYRSHNSGRRAQLKHPSGQTSYERIKAVSEDTQARLIPNHGVKSTATSNKDGGKYGVFDVFSRTDSQQGILLTGRSTINPFIQTTRALDYLNSYDSRPPPRSRPIKVILTDTETADAGVPSSRNPAGPNLAVSGDKNGSPARRTLPQTSPSAYSRIALLSGQISRNTIHPPRNLAHSRTSYLSEPKTPNPTTTTEEMKTSTRASIEPETTAKSLPEIYGKKATRVPEIRETMHPSQSPTDSIDFESDSERRRRLRRMRMWKRLQQQKRRRAGQSRAPNSSPRPTEHSRGSVSVHNLGQKTSRFNHHSRWLISGESSRVILKGVTIKAPSITINNGEGIASVTGDRKIITKLKSTTSVSSSLSEVTMTPVAMVTEGMTTTAQPLQLPPTVQSELDNSEEGVGSGEYGNDNDQIDDQIGNSKPYFVQRTGKLYTKNSQTTPGLIGNTEEVTTATAVDQSTRRGRNREQDFDNPGRRWSVSQEAWDNRNTSKRTNQIKDSNNKDVKHNSGNRRHRKNNNLSTTQNSVINERSTVSAKKRKPARNSAAKRWRERLKKRRRRNRRKNRRRNSRRGSMAIAKESPSNTPPPKVAAGKVVSEVPEGEKSPFIGYKTAYDFLSGQKGSKERIVTSESRRESFELNRYMGEGMCEIFNKHYVSTRIGGKCE